jgi:hypothetical protein
MIIMSSAYTSLSNRRRRRRRRHCNHRHRRRIGRNYDFSLPYDMKTDDRHHRRRRGDEPVAGSGVGSRLKATFGSNFEAVAMYRISLGIMLFIELVSRYKYLHAFYSDEG